MGYVDQNLLPGETVIYRAKLHPIIFASAIFFAVVGVFFLIVGSIDKAVSGFAILGVFFLAVGGLFGLARYVRLATSEFAITDKRVLVKVGLVRRHTLELLLAKVETIGVDQGVLGRLFDYGTIIVTGTGGTKEPFKAIANPLEFRKQVQSRAAG
jgi:uncharacterized membrane protein YdbT with pleckstrin-like domain